MNWTVETLNKIVVKELETLPSDMRARFSRVVVVRVFVKKTQKTPRREIQLALERAKEVLE